MAESDSLVPASASESPSVTSTLLKLLNSFPDSLHPPQQLITRLADLADGLCLVHFLAALEPLHFELDPLQTGSDGVVDAPSRASNLQYLLDCLETFFEDSMQKTFDLAFLDVTVLSETSEAELEAADVQRLHLLELVLLCAINSARKEDVIHEIMSFSDAEQQTLMNVIHDAQERADKTGATMDLDVAAATESLDDSISSRKNSIDVEADVESASSSHASAAQATAALLAVQTLQAEKTELTRALDAANREVRDWKRKAHETSEASNDAATAAAAELQKAVSQTASDVARDAADRSKGDHARLAKEVSRAEQRSAELEQANKAAQEALLASGRELAKISEVADERAGEIERLRDELQVAASRAEELVAAQAKLDKLKARLGEIDEVKLQAASLEAENSKQLDRIIELESEAREIDSLKAQLTRMKDAAFQAESTLLDKTLSEEQARSELVEAKEQLGLLRTEHRAMEAELKATKTELESAVQKARPSPRNDDFADTSEVDDSKQIIRRLEFELNKLRSAQTESGSADGASASELALLRQQKESLQEKYLESQRKAASSASESEKRSRDLAERLAAAERRAEEDAQAWAQEKEDLSRVSQQGDAQSSARAEEVTQLRAELIELHEQLDAARGASAAALDMPAVRSVPPSPARSSAPSEASVAAAAAAAADLEALTVRNRKLEAYIKQQQKKTKLLEEAQEKTQQQLATTHEAYKAARTELISRERELVDREKVRVSDTAHVSRERKLLSSAFYSMGMEFQSALVAGRAVAKNQNNTMVGKVSDTPG